MTPPEQSGNEVVAIGVISLAVLFASSTWFAGAAAGLELARELGLDASGAAGFTTATQAGFVVGTLLYAVGNLADRWSPRGVFALSAGFGAVANLGFANAGSAELAYLLRFLNGLFLAGVYPVGMKLVAAWSPHGLGARLGWMVGALTLGTGFPYFVRGFDLGEPGRGVAVVASIAAVIGAGLVYLVPVGPHAKPGARFDPRMIWRPFLDLDFRRNALGYFGHMVELYAFWSLLPAWIGEARPQWEIGEVQRAAALIVGLGVVGCVGGGHLSLRLGELRVARVALATSGLCCLTSPLWLEAPTPVASAILCLWGMSVIADSPQFSALAARTCPPEYLGTALTVQNGVGFLVTVVAIQGTAQLGGSIGYHDAFLVLAIGPVFGLWALRHGVRVRG